jgi:hypothetical protein
LKSRSEAVVVTIESETIGRDAQLAVLLRHRWHAEIERAVDKVKFGILPARKRTKTDKWFRKQWYRALAVSKRRERQVLKQSEDRLWR